jgi:hypothetical protein
LRAKSADGGKTRVSFRMLLIDPPPGSWAMVAGSAVCTSGE